MKKITFAAIAACICIFSCSKKNDQLQKSQSNLLGNYNSCHHGPAKKETIPIVIMRPIRPNGFALPSAIRLTNNTDTLVGQTSVDSPACSFQLTKAGQWLVKITSPGYVPISETVDYEDSVVYQVDTLQPAN